MEAVEHYWVVVTGVRRAETLQVLSGPSGLLRLRERGLQAVRDALSSSRAESGTNEENSALSVSTSAVSDGDPTAQGTNQSFDVHSNSDMRKAANPSQESDARSTGNVVTLMKSGGLDEPTVHTSEENAQGSSRHEMEDEFDSPHLESDIGALAAMMTTAIHETGPASSPPSETTTVDPPLELHSNPQ